MASSETRRRARASNRTKGTSATNAANRKVNLIRLTTPIAAPSDSRSASGARVSLPSSISNASSGSVRNQTSGSARNGTQARTAIAAAHGDAQDAKPSQASAQHVTAASAAR